MMNEEASRDDFDDDGLGDLVPVEGESPGLPQSPGPASSAASALASDACEEEEMRKELWSEFQAVEDQCDIAAQMMDAMAEEGISSIPDLLLDIVDFLDLVRPRLLKLTQEGSVGELDEESFAKSLEVNDRVCSLLKKFVSIERALLQQQQEKALQAQQEADALARQRHRVRGVLTPSGGGGGGGSSGSGSGRDRPAPPPPPPASSAWTSHTTKDGRTYYYNHETKLSVWTRPAELGPDPNTVAPPQPLSGTAASASTPAAAVRVISAVPAGAASTAAASPAPVVRVSPAAVSATPTLPDGENPATSPVASAVAAVVPAATLIASSSSAATASSEIVAEPLRNETGSSNVPVTTGTDVAAMSDQKDDDNGDVAEADHAVGGGGHFSPPPAYDEVVEDAGDAPPAYSAVAETGTTSSTGEFSLDDL